MAETYLFIGPAERERLAALRTYALAHRVDLATMKGMAAGTIPPIGDDAAHVVQLAGGYRVVYSIEQQSPGWYHHLSVSVARRGRYPRPEGVEMIMRELGITRPLRQCRTWLEEAVQAINVMAPLEEGAER